MAAIATPKSVADDCPPSSIESPRHFAHMRATMTLPEMAGFVKKLKPPFLQDLEHSDVCTVLSLARQRHFLAHSVVTNQGHPASHIFMVLTGGAHSFFLTQAGQRLHIHWYPPGEMFGGMAMVLREGEYIVSTEA